MFMFVFVCVCVAVARCFLCESFYMSMKSKANDADVARLLMNRFSFVFNSVYNFI